MSNVELANEFGALDVIENRPQETSLAALNKSEVEAQLDAAHKYKRQITRFMQEAQTLSTVSVEVAESCMYALPRGGKTISGPSVRLAEICASAYGNLRVASRIIAIDGDSLTAQGIVWDMEKNVGYSVDVRRKITGKNGQRFNEDMINVTAAAATSIAIRNVIFRAIPRAYVDRLFENCKRVAVGDVSTLVDRRAKVLDRLALLGVDQARVLARLEKTGVDDIGLSELEFLIAEGTAIKQGERSIDEAFPAPLKGVAATAGAPDGKRMSLKKDPIKDAKATAVVEKPLYTPPDVEEAKPAAESREPGGEG